MNVPAEETRWPPIQCRVSTATPATLAASATGSAVPGCTISVLIDPPRFNA